MAGRRRAKSWELRAAMSLSRLWPQQGKRAEAREFLAPIYSWFTKGFDTPDLQEPIALLDDLRTYGSDFPPTGSQRRLGRMAWQEENGILWPWYRRAPQE
jgi:hypothetical protein